MSMLPGPIPVLSALHRLVKAMRRFVAPSFFRTRIELTKSCFQRDRGRLFGVDGVGNQCAKTERGDHTGSIREGYLRIAEVVAFRRDLGEINLLDRVHINPSITAWSLMIN
jgi:hypothetical protein